MGEGTVADGRSGDGGEPAVEDGELGREVAEDGKLVGGEVVEDLVRVRDVSLFLGSSWRRSPACWAGGRRRFGR